MLYKQTLSLIFPFHVSLMSVHSAPYHKVCMHVNVICHFYQKLTHKEKKKNLRIYLEMALLWQSMQIYI